MTAEIEKLMMGYSWNVEKSIFFNFIISSRLAFSINYSKLAWHTGCLRGYWATCYGQDNGKKMMFKGGHLLIYSSSSAPVWNEQRCCSAAEWLQEVLQKSCKSAGLQQPQISAAVESPLTAINSALAAVQKIPESRSALQSGCKVALKRQRMLLCTGNGLPLVSTKKRNAGSNNTIIMIHGRGVDKVLVAE